jgi:integrase
MHIDVRIIPWLGLIKLASLTRTDLNNFYNRIITEGSNPKDKNSKTDEKTKTDNNTPPKPIGKETILYNHRIIHRILNDAVYVDEILPRNVADRMILPEPPKPADYDPDEDLVKVFTGTEIITLETNADSTSYSELLTVALRTGMRRGELLALSWDAIDYNSKTIFVKRALSYTKEKGYEFKLTKNNTRRKIEVTTEVLDALRIQGLVHQILQEKLGTYYEDNNLVFCREDGKPMYPGTAIIMVPRVL